MRKSLLATVAAVAVIAGAGKAAAADNERGSAGAPGMSDMKGHAQTNKGVEHNGARVNRSETTGAGSSEMKAEPSTGKAEMKSDQTGGTTHMKSERNADTKNKSQTKGSSAAESGSKADTNRTGAADTKSKSTTGSSAADTKSKSQASSPSTTEKSGANEKGSAKSSTSAQSDAKAGGTVSLSSEQKTKIRTTVLESRSAPKVSRSEINFNIRVGTVVPRSVHFVTVPSTLVEIHPAWRGYSYFVVEDEIVIIDPHTLRIVAVLVV
jgi:hypothetical protein